MVQKQKNNNVSKSRLITLLICLSFFILAIIYCRNQKVFTVKQINVQGQFELSDKEIIQTSGIKRGSNMFNLDILQGIKNLTSEPYIYNVYIFRQFPDIINIHVIERNPILLIRLSKDYAIDAFGIMLPMPTNYALETLPIITGLDPSLPFEVGKMTLNSDIRNAIDFIIYTQSFDQELISYTSYMHWSIDKGWTIRKNKNYPEVQLGKTNLNEQFDMLKAFLDKMKNDGVDVKKFKYINLRFENQIIVSE